MLGKQCKLYDEHLVRTIIVTTGLTALDFIRGRGNAGEEELCEYLELNAQGIIDDTLEEMDNTPLPSDGDLFRLDSGRLEGD